MNKYIFTLKYTSDFTYKKEIEAENPFEAWKAFSEWVTGFVSDGSNGLLESVKVSV